MDDAINNETVGVMNGSQLAQASRIQNLEAQLADEEQQSKDLDELVTDQGVQITQLEAQIADLSRQNAQLGQQIAGLNEQKAQLEDQVAGLSDQNAQLEHQVAVKQANLEQAWEKNDEDHDEIEELQRELAYIQATHPHQWGPDPPEELALAHDDLVGCE
jgi:chromosome segregation ATPase